MEAVKKRSLLAGLICLAAGPSPAQRSSEAEKSSAETAFTSADLKRIHAEAARSRQGSQAAGLDQDGVPPGITDIDGPIGLSLTVAIKYEAAPEELAKIEKAFRRFSTLVWNETWGNMYIAQASLRNGYGEGYITMDKLPQNEGGSAYFNGPFIISTNLLNMLSEDIGIRVLAAGMLHEFNHSMFLLHDEYPGEGEPETPVKMCVMDPRSRMTGLCPHCQGLLLERFKKFRFPDGVEPKEWSARNPVPETMFIREGGRQ